jgi:hypothetical protein
MKTKLGRWIAVLAGLTYVAAWAASLVVALRDHSREVLPPDGHGTLEAAYMTLVGITQPLGLLAGPLLAPVEPSGRPGTVLLWCVAGILGALQWIGVATVVRTVWTQFWPTRTTLHLK